jgi:hypothetical protein
MGTDHSLERDAFILSSCRLDHYPAYGDISLLYDEESIEYSRLTCPDDRGRRRKRSVRPLVVKHVVTRVPAR